jgi:hypothetical protein
MENVAVEEHGKEGAATKEDAERTPPRNTVSSRGFDSAKLCEKREIFQALKDRRLFWELLERDFFSSF